MLGRYVARTFILYWIGILLFSLFIFLFIELISPSSEDIFLTSEVVKSATFLFPSYLSYFFPVVTFLASILTLGRLSTQNELVGALSIGMEIKRLMGWTGGIVILITCVSYLFSLYIGPLGWRNLEKTLTNLVVEVKNLPLKKFVSKKNISVYRDENRRIFLNIRNDAYSTIIIGNNAQPSSEGLIVSDGNGIFISRKNIYRFSFKSLEIPKKALKLERGGNKKAMWINELIQFSRDLKKYHFNPNPPLVEISERIFYPLSVIFFFLVSIPIGMRISSESFIFSIVFSIIFYLVMFALYSGLKILSNRGFINPYSGPAIYILLLAILTFLLYITHRKRMSRFE